MKLSYFNYEIPFNDFELIVYNSLTGAVIRIKRCEYSIDNTYLKKDGFIVPDDINEIDLYKFRYLAGIYNNKSWHFTIAPTMQCNFNCPYCFEGNNKKEESFMKTEVKDSIKRLLKLKSGKFINITWFGGEPFLGWESISDITEFLLEEGIEFRATAITNGSICTEKVLSNIDRYKIKSIQITLDGDKDTHDSKRAFKNGYPSFDLLINNIHKYLKETNVEIVVRINLDKDNLGKFSELDEFLKSEYKDYIENHRMILSPNPIRNRTEFDGCKNCLSNQEYQDFEYFKLSVKKLPSYCGPCSLRCRSSIGICPDGYIYKCLEHFGDRTKAIGSILDGVDLNKEAKYSVGILPFEVEQCRVCKLLPVCGGGCPIDLERFVEGQQQEPPCTINNRMLNKQISRYYEIEE